MGTDKTILAEVVLGGATGSDVTESEVSHVTRSDVTGRDPDRK